MCLILVNGLCTHLCRLGQACNHVAALLFFIEGHTHDNELPTEKSRTSLPMRWNQPPKKTKFANNMNFVKPSQGDDPEVHSSKQIKWSSFNPHQPEHQVLDEHSMEYLLSHALESVPNTGLQQFWQTNSLTSTSINFEALQHYVFFSHAHTSTISQKKVFFIQL